MGKIRAALRGQKNDKREKKTTKPRIKIFTKNESKIMSIKVNLKFEI